MATELEIPAHELDAIHNRAAADFSTIKTATLKALSLNYSYEETVHEVTDTVTRKSGAPAHKDLQAAFHALAVHFAVIVEDVSPDEIEEDAIARGDVESLTNIPFYDEEGERQFGSLLQKKIALYDVFSFHRSANAVSLTGTRKLSTDEYVEITTPRIKWDESTYPYLNELRAAMDHITEEIKLYKNGKVAPVARQMDFDFDAADEAA